MMEDEVTEDDADGETNAPDEVYADADPDAAVHQVVA
jgi:hypothetical protein